MRELKLEELENVAGGLVCTPENSFGGITNPDTVGDGLISIYEGVVSFASHVIERVATAW